MLPHSKRLRGSCLIGVLILLVAAREAKAELQLVQIEAHGDAILI